MKYNGDYKKFMERVGWRSGDDFVSYGYLKFSPSLSSKGELSYAMASIHEVDVVRLSLFSRNDL